MSDWKERLAKGRAESVERDEARKREEAILQRERELERDRERQEDFEKAVNWARHTATWDQLITLRSRIRNQEELYRRGRWHGVHWYEKLDFVPRIPSMWSKAILSVIDEVESD